MEYKWQTLNCHTLTPFVRMGFYNINIHTGDPTHDHLGNSTIILGQRTQIMGRVCDRILRRWDHSNFYGIRSNGKYDHLESRISLRIQMVRGQIQLTLPRRIISPSSISPIMQVFSSRNLILILLFTTVIQNGFARTFIANTLQGTSEIVRPAEQTNRFAFRN